MKLNNEWTGSSLRRALLVAVIGVVLTTLPNPVPAGEEKLPPGEGPPIRVERTEEVDFIEATPDPLERFNRTMYYVNHGLMLGVVRPTSKVYHAVAPRPLRDMIDAAGENLGYPGRLINNLLQGKWEGAGNESLRFLVNSTLGFAGLFDVATAMEIEPSDEDFGQTFGAWGWDPNFFLMLPLLGPSNDRDLPGRILDNLVYPPTWYPAPTYLVDSKSWAPSASSVISYNDLAENADRYEQLTATQSDPYDLSRYVWHYYRDSRVANLGKAGAADDAALQTLQAVFLTYQDAEFLGRRETGSVISEATGKRVNYNYWLQRGPAPVVFIVPGLGGHRRSNGTVAMAELVFRQGFSAVSISSAYNTEFMETAASPAMPGYTPIDVRDTHRLLSRIHEDLKRRHPGRMEEKILMGYSMGGFHTLMIAGGVSGEDPGWLKFDRFIAIDAPVSLTHGLEKLDDFYNAPLQWPAAERRQRIQNTLLKVASLAQGTFTPNKPMPFSRIESQYLIGLAFRVSLRDIIFTSQYLHDMGILHAPLSRFRREPVYREIVKYSYAEYFQEFVVPYYQERGIDLTREDEFARAGSLRFVEARLRANENCYAFVNRNDFLLRPQDLDWYRETFPGRVRIFEYGGHLGNLHFPEVQHAIVSVLTDLIPPSGSRDR